MKNIIIILICLLSSFFCLGQDDDGKGVVSTQSSPRGNYVKVLIEGEGNLIDNVMDNTQYFRVEKLSVFKGEEKAKPIGEIRKVQTYEELVNIVGSENTESIKEAFGFSSNQEVMDYISKNNKLEDFFFFCQLDVNFLVATGYAFYDPNVSKGDVDTYLVYRIDVDGSEEYWGSNTIVGLGGNVEVNNINIEVSEIIGMDSGVVFQWKPVFQDSVVRKEPNEENLQVVENTPIDKRKEIPDFNLVVYTPFFNPFELEPGQTKFRTYYKINDELLWHEGEINIAGLDSTTNELIFSLAVNCLPEDIVYAKVVVEDYVGNLSDDLGETMGMAITNARTVLIYGIDAVDSTNSVVVSWDPLPNKAYYTGIEIAKTDTLSDDGIIVVDVLPPDVSQYIDYDVYPAGRVFVYYVRALFLPKQNLVQEMPATAAAAAKVFSRPLPPFNLEVEDMGTQPKLTWESAEDPVRFAFYLYRGNSPSELELVNNNIFENEFVDTTISFSPRSTYYYAALAMNVTQDTSDFSNIITYTPLKGDIGIKSPTNINHTLVNGNLFLEWDDEQKTDDFVHGYILQRKNESIPNTNFASLHDDYLAEAFFVDTTFNKTNDYLYRIASVGMNGDTAAFSMSVEVGFMLDLVQGVSEVELYNYPEGISVTWPAVDYDQIKGYSVYKRNVNEALYTEIAQIGKGTFSYLDKEVEIDEQYVYAITIIEQDDRESRIKAKKTLRRAL